MTLKRSCARWCGVVLLMALGGCASAYHNYPCGCIPYGYCPHPPLTYTAYDACPTPVATCYLAEKMPPAMQVDTSPPDTPR